MWYTLLIPVLAFVFTSIAFIILSDKHGGNYRIFKGLNYSGIWFFKMFFTKREPFQARVILDKSCEVKTNGVQKIFGIGDLFHHNNSDRFGFIYEGNGRYGIYSYQYRKGELQPWTKLGTVESGEVFYIVFNKSIVDRYKKGRYLYPYFEQDGDAEKGAPHTMLMNINFHIIIDPEYIEGDKNIQSFNLN